jgi:hypothetical protein
MCRNRKPGHEEIRRILCPEAEQALGLAVCSLFLVGPVLGPIAIWRGLDARSRIASSPYLSGAGMANAAILVGAVGIVLSLVEWSIPFPWR